MIGVIGPNGQHVTETANKIGIELVTRNFILLVMVLIHRPALVQVIFVPLDQQLVHDLPFMDVYLLPFLFFFFLFCWLFFCTSVELHHLIINRLIGVAILLAKSSKMKKSLALIIYRER